jgi:hypothetical protein
LFTQNEATNSFYPAGLFVTQNYIVIPSEIYTEK